MKAIEADQKKQNKANKKAKDDAEKEARKSTPEGKAAKWITGLSKDLADIRLLIKSGKKSETVPAAKRNPMMKMLESEAKNLAELRDKLETSQGHGALTAALDQAEDVVKSAKQQVKMWKQLERTYKPAA